AGPARWFWAAAAAGGTAIAVVTAWRAPAPAGGGGGGGHHRPRGRRGGDRGRARADRFGQPSAGHPDRAAGCGGAEHRGDLIRPGSVLIPPGHVAVRRQPGGPFALG